MPASPRIANPQYLVETDWLAAHLAGPDPRAFGFDNAAILNGGIDKWKAEDRPLSTEAPRPAPARFVARPRHEMIATKSQVAAAIADPRVRVVNALTAKQHTGEGGANYGRPGRIAGSVNVPAHRLVDGESKVFL